MTQPSATSIKDLVLWRLCNVARCNSRQWLILQPVKKAPVKDRCSTQCEHETQDTIVFNARRNDGSCNNSATSPRRSGNVRGIKELLPTTTQGAGRVGECQIPYCVVDHAVRPTTSVLRLMTEPAIWFSNTLRVQEAPLDWSRGSGPP